MLWKRWLVGWSPAPGFMGEGHTAVTVVDPNEFQRSDPFILLMDDRLDLPPGREAGGAHPHGGFETVTFVVEGALRDRDEGTLNAGDVLWMTAGSGVIHNERVVNRVMSLRERMITEVGKSVDVAYNLCALLDKHHVELEVHADVNTDPHFKSNVAFRDAMGYIMGMGFVFKAKPDAIAASCCADKVL